MRSAVEIEENAALAGMYRDYVGRVQRLVAMTESPRWREQVAAEEREAEMEGE